MYEVERGRERKDKKCVRHKKRKGERERACMRVCVSQNREVLFV